MSEDGFYWVKIYEGEGWRAAELENGKWWIVGSSDPWTREEIREVGPK